MIATISGVFSLFPLLFTPTGNASSSLFDEEVVDLTRKIESVIEVIYSIAWFALLYIPLSKRVYE